jgi:hypothetical protein
MMGGVSPETCWASYKYGIIQILIHCCILLDFSLRIVLASCWIFLYKWKGLVSSFYWSLAF